MTRLAQIVLSLMMVLGFIAGPATAQPVRAHAEPMQPDCGMACCQAEQSAQTCCEGEKPAPKPEPKDECPCFAPGEGGLPAAVIAPPLTLSVPAILEKQEIAVPQAVVQALQPFPVLDLGHPIRGPTLPFGSRAPPSV